MPTYQYVCTNPAGKHEFEVVQSFTDPAVSTCTTCEAPVRKVYGSVGVVFKGSGFYRTDSRGADSASSTAAASAKESSAAKESPSSKESASTASTAASSSSTSSPSSSSKAASAH